MSDLRLWLPGGASDAAASGTNIDLTGDITLVADITIYDHTPAATAAIIGDRSGSTGEASLRLATTGHLNVLWWEGATARQAPSSATLASVGLGDGDRVEIAVERDNAAPTNHVIRFYWRAPGGTWAQLGSDTASFVGAAAPTSVANVLTIGANGFSPPAAQVHTAAAYTGFAISGSGTLVADFDPARDATLGDTTLTSSTTGEVWTLAGDALLIGAPAAAQAVNDRPLYLDLPGAVTDYASTPDSAYLDAITQDLTIVAEFTEWADQADDTAWIVSGGYTSPNRSWGLSKRTPANDSDLRLYLSSDGAAADGILSMDTADTYITDGTWLKVESLVVSGARSTKWYTSPVGPDHPAFAGWTLRETDSGGPTTIATNNVTAAIGYDVTRSEKYTGKLGRVLVYAGDEDTGALIVDFAPERDAYLGAGSFTSSNTGEVWTLAGSAELRSAGGRIDWVNADDEGLELPSRDVISGLTAPARRHNIATTPQRAGGYLVQSPLPNPRTVTVPVLLRPAAPYTRARLDELRQRFAGVLHHPQLGRLIVADQNSDLRELRCFLANGLAGAEGMPAHEFDTFQFVAPDPYFYDLDDDTASIVSGTNTLTVAGDTDTPPIFTITGGASSNITSVTLERVDTGETLALTLTSALTTGVALIIDHAAGTVLRAGSDIFSDLTSPTFFDLASGASSQVALTLGGTAGSYTGSVTYRPRWLTAYPAAS